MLDGDEMGGQFGRLQVEPPVGGGGLGTGGGLVGREAEALVVVLDHAVAAARAVFAHQRCRPA